MITPGDYRQPPAAPKEVMFDEISLLVQDYLDLYVSKKNIQRSCNIADKIIQMCSCLCIDRTNQDRRLERWTDNFVILDLNETFDSYSLEEAICL